MAPQLSRSFIDSESGRCVLWWQQGATKSIWTVYKFGECVTLQRLASNYVQPFSCVMARWPCGPQDTFPPNICTCQTFRLNSGLSPIRSQGWAAPRGSRHHEKMFFPFKPQVWCWRVKTEANEGAPEREIDRGCAIDLSLPRLVQSFFPYGRKKGGDGILHCRFPTAKQSSSRDSSLGLKKVDSKSLVRIRVRSELP